MVNLKEYLAIKKCVRKHVKYLKFYKKRNNCLHFEDKLRNAEKEFIAALNRLQELNILDENNFYTNKKYQTCIVKLQKRHAILRAEFEEVECALQN